MRGIEWNLEGHLNLIVTRLIKCHLYKLHSTVFQELSINRVKTRPTPKEVSFAALCHTLSNVLDTYRETTLLSPN